LVLTKLTEAAAPYQTLLPEECRRNSEDVRRMSDYLTQRKGNDIMAKTELGARIALAKTNEKRANKLAQMIDIREKGIVLTTEQEMYNLYIDRDEAYHVMKCLWSDVFNMLETK
jgi:hypothetical protein